MRWPARRIARVLVTGACWLSALAICGLHVAAAFGPAGAWPIHLVLYGPRWAAAGPLLLLAPWAFFLRLRWCLLPLSLAAYSFVTLWGWNVPWERLLGAGEAAVEPLRVLTCNVQGSDLRIRDFADYIAASQPDVICLQECKLDDPPTALGLVGWASRSAGEFCVLSRDPIVEFTEFRVTAERSRRVAVQTRLLRAGKEVTLIATHLITPRQGLQAIIERPWAGIPTFRSVTAVQDTESGQLRRRAEGLADRVVVVGDFNLTAEHPIYRRDWSAYRDAFSWTRWGLGHTFLTRSVGLRIDHILCGPGWTPQFCELGPDVGSAHLPVVAELVESPPG